MLTHYRELLRYYKNSILLASLMAGAVALGLSLLLLRSMPIFEASVTLNMQPSIEELQFNKGFLGVSQFNPATIIAQTHIEGILSRPVAERAIDKLIEQNGGNLPSDPPTAFDEFRAFISQSIKVLNFGYFTELPEREIYITDLINATSIEIVEGSYILLISISHTSPVVAARAADALAEAYVEQRQVDFAKDADRVDQTLQTVRERVEVRLAELIADRRAIATQAGVTGTASERTYLLEVRSAARTTLEDAQVDLLQQRTRLNELRDAVGKEGDANIARQLRQSLVEVRAGIAGAEARQELRETNWRMAEQALRNLDVAEESFLEIDQRVSDAKLDLSELQQRAIQIQLAREARLSQVTTINTAQIPVYPKFPKVMVNTVVGLILGAILVLVPISAIDVLGNRLRTTEDLRGSFGPRTLPVLTPRLSRQARKFLDQGGRAPPSLQRYAEQIGRRLSFVDPSKKPLTTLFVTSMGAKAGDESLADLMKAVVLILDRKRADGTPLPVTALPPISMISDWGEMSMRHVVVGIYPAENIRTEVENITNTLTDKSSVFGILVS